MAKSKAQKQQEAQWRGVRGKLVDHFRACEGEEDRILDHYGQWYLDEREKLWEAYKQLPREWREQAMGSASQWKVPPKLQERLDRLAVEERARDLARDTVEAPRARARMRL